MPFFEWLSSQIKGDYQLLFLIPLNQIAIGIGIAYLALPTQRYAQRVMDVIEKYTAHWNNTYKHETMADKRDAAVTALHLMKAVDFHAKKKKTGTFFGLELIQKRHQPMWTRAANIHINTLPAKDCVEATLMNNPYTFRDMFSRDVILVTIFTATVTLFTIFISIFSDQKVSIHIMLLGILLVLACSAMPAYCVIRGRAYVERCNDAAKTLDFWLVECAQAIN